MSSAPPQRRRLPKGPLAVGVLLLVVAVLFRPATQWAVERRAREAGVELRSFRLEVGISEIDLHDVEASLVDVPGVAVRADLLRVPIPRFSPTGVSGRNVTVEVPARTGALFDLVAWATRERPGALPITIASLGMRAGALSVQKLAVTPIPEGGLVRGGELQVAGVPFALALPPIAWTSQPSALTVGIGMDAPARVELVATQARRSARLVLRETRLETLARLLGDAAPALPDVTVDASVELGVPVPTGPITGRVEARIHGVAWASLPLPPGALSLTTSLTIDEAGATGQLGATHVTLGAVTLTGSGSMTFGAGVSLRAELAARVPCSALLPLPGLLPLGDAGVRLDVAASTAGPSFVVRPSITPCAP